MVDKAIPIPIPLRGLNTVQPDVPLESLYARELTNYSINGGRLQMRPNVDHSSYASTATSNYIWFNNSRGVTRTGQNIRLSDGTVMATIASVANTAKPFLIKHASLDLVIGVAAPRGDDDPFTPWTFTTIGITDTNITSAISHKGRLYVCDGDTIEYSAVGQVTGAMAGTFAISQFMEGQKVVFIGSIGAVPGNTGAESIFFIFGEGGKVLAYQGDFPSSSTWNLIGNYDMPALVNGRCVLGIEGDYFVATDQYCYWVSSLLLGSREQAYANRPSAPIANVWQQCEWKNATYDYAHVWYLSELDAIVCQCREKNALRSYFQYNNDSCSFVYFRKYNAWAIWDYTPLFAPIRKTGLIYTGTTYEVGTLSRMRTDIAFNDYDREFDVGVGEFENTQIQTSWKTPFISPFAGRVQKLVGVRPYYRYTKRISSVHSLTSEIQKIRAIFDYSDYYQRSVQSVSLPFYQQATSISAPFVPNNYSDVAVTVPATPLRNYSPYVGLVGLGGGLSLQITYQAPSYTSGAEVNFEVYALTAYIQDGGIFI